MKKYFGKTCLSLPLILSSFGYADNAAMSDSATPPTSVIGNLGAKDRMRTCVDGWGGYAVGSFIYWKSQIQNLDVALRGESLNSIPFVGSNPETREKLKGVHFQYDPGFKLGVGFNFKRDVWDLFLNWTSLESTTHTTYNDSHNNLIGLLAGQGGNGTSYAAQVKSKWHFKFNTLDLELGRDYYLGKYVKLRPFGSIKTAWIKYNLKSNYNDVVNGSGHADSNVFPSTVFTKDNIWGIGPRFGLNTRWILGHWNVGIVANFAASLIWEDLKPKWKEESFTAIAGPAETLLIPAQAQIGAHRKEWNPVLELFLGLDWGTCIMNTTFLTLSAGWEVQYWWSQYDVFSPPLQYHDDRALNLSGLTASLRLDF